MIGRSHTRANTLQRHIIILGTILPTHIPNISQTAKHWCGRLPRVLWIYMLVGMENFL